MKKVRIIPALTLVYAILNTSIVFCQPTGGFAITTPQIQKIDTPIDKNNSYSGPGKNSLNSIPISVVRAFLKDFKDAENVSWFKATNGGCAAQFLKDSIQITARYSSNGTWNYTLKRYAEKKMSADLRTLVKATFFDYAINEVTEITMPNEEDIIYRVMIKNKDGFKILIICRGEMQVTGDYSIL